ncbi:MAG: 4Fe-4S dicluster domain-containing protein [Anaerolineales bacterium]|jgi:ferredoxin
MLNRFFERDDSRRRALAVATVVPEPSRCVQCGICSYNCPLGVDVRRHARLGQAISEQACLTCGECVARCPRSVLRFETAAHQR